MSEETISLEDARRRLRADYWEDVRNVAQDVIDQWKGDADMDRDSLIEYLDQTVDGHSRVIYTAQALECLLFSEHDDAMMEEMGSIEGAVTRDSINWSVLAYFAFKADIIRQLDAMDFDINDPAREGEDEEDEDEEIETCAQCGLSLVAHTDIALDHAFVRRATDA